MKKMTEGGLFLLASAAVVAGFYLLTGSQGEVQAQPTEKPTPQQEYCPIIEQAARFEKSRAKKDSESYIQLVDSQLDVAGQANRLWYQHFWSHSAFQYAFYDIDKDGSQELLIGSSSEVNAIYSLKAGKPSLQLIGSFDTVGGLRSSLEILQDGTIIQSEWNNYSSDIHATAYRLKNDQVKAGKDVWLTFESGKTAKGMLKNPSDHLDLSKLKWQSFAQGAEKTVSASGGKDQTGFSS